MMTEQIQTTKPKIFISYAWENKAMARRLEAELRSAGAEVWVDHSGVRGGDNLPKRISDALELCNTVLLIWSLAASRSHWVELEWTNAISLQKVIIPCILDETKLPAILANKTFVDFHSFNKGLAQLLLALNIPQVATASAPLDITKPIDQAPNKQLFDAPDMETAKFNKRKADLIYTLELKKIIESDHQERSQLTEQHRNAGKSGSGFAFEEFAKLIREQIKRHAEILVAADFQGLEENKIVDEQMEEMLIKRLINSVDTTIALEKNLLREKLAAHNVTGASAEGELNRLEQAGVWVKDQLIQKIQLDVIKRNESVTGARMSQKISPKSEQSVSKNQHAISTGGQVIQAGRDVIITQPASGQDERKDRAKRIATWVGIVATLATIITTILAWPQIFGDLFMPTSSQYYGVVKDESDQPVADATIQVKEASNSTGILGIGQTHSNGEFSILVKIKPGSTVWVHVGKQGYSEFSGMKNLGGSDKIILSKVRRGS